MIAIIKLDPAEVADLAAALQRSEIEVLVAIDGPGQESRACVKVKIDGGIWSPPMGREVR